MPVFKEKGPRNGSLFAFPVLRSYLLAMNSDQIIDFVFSIIGRILYVAAFAAALYIAGRYGPAFGQWLFG